MDKKANLDMLDDIVTDSEVIQSSEPALEKETVKVRKRKIEKRQNFSISLTITEYNKFMDYLEENDIRYGGVFIRNLLKEKGII